ncbi:hypothetical protein C8R45DRAFT_144131 [Mycena sanguinolenta]|nr:hypothetical protein C8R45DRAFT_144131 [Mycena sanguinolenta]
MPELVPVNDFCSVDFKCCKCYVQFQCTVIMSLNNNITKYTFFGSMLMFEGDVSESKLITELRGKAGAKKEARWDDTHAHSDTPTAAARHGPTALVALSLDIAPGKMAIHPHPPIHPAMHVSQIGLSSTRKRSGRPIPISSIPLRAIPSRPIRPKQKRRDRCKSKKRNQKASAQGIDDPFAQLSVSESA